MKVAIKPYLRPPNADVLESHLTLDQMARTRTRGSEPLKLPKLIGDERRLLQVLINLLKNAIKFTKRGHIKLSASFDSIRQRLIVHVSDTGVGIAEQDFCKLFNRFGKLHRTAEMNHEGIGLGLTIVKQIVEKAGG